MTKKVIKSPEQWQAELTPHQYHITRQKGTEPAFTGEYYENKQSGEYLCVCCGESLFLSDAKYDSGSGWPSFWQAKTDGVVAEQPDSSHGMYRVEIVCAHCDAHLGHVFTDGPQPTGQRYCVNSASLRFKPAQ